LPASVSNVPLPIARKINALAALHCQRRNPAHLIAIRDAPVIFPPRTFLRITEEVRTCNMVVNADLSASQAAEVLFGPIGAGSVERIGFLIVDPFDFKAFM
jgi:hypothetical protein